MFARAPLAAALSALTLVACSKPPPAPPPVVDAGAPPAKSVTVLVTGHETGLLPEKAPRLLAQWKTQDGWPHAFVLSTGDTFSGEALSSHFQGEPTAEAMKALNYKAAAFGNHDLDLGFDVLGSFTKSAGLTFLAANLSQKAGAERPLALPATTLVEQGGVKVGVVGLTSEKTVTTTAWGKAAGLEVAKPETVLPAALADLRAKGAQAVVVIVDDCFTGLAEQFRAHADWKVDLVVGSRCEGEPQAKVGAVPFFSVEDDLEAYVSAKVTVTGGAVAVEAARRVLQPKGPEDEDLVALRTRWKAKLDLELGQPIGFAKKGLGADAPELRWLVAKALMTQAKADAGLINQKGVREGLPKGPISRATVHSMLPFENTVLVVKVPGEVLQKLKADRAAVLVGPAKIDPKKTYTLATTEYLYFGGDGLGLDVVDPNPEPTGLMWQTPVIEWIQAQGSTEKKPLEPMLKR